MKDNVLIIAEAGVNHNNDLDTALKLCDAAKKAGADVVKFQTWKTENLITHNVSQADYQSRNTRFQESQFDMLKKLEFSYDKFRKVKDYCNNIGIAFASTADEQESLDFLIELGIPFIKIGSGDIGNVSYLRYIGSKGLPIILSTGMSTLADVDISLTALCDGGISREKITLLHCTTNYPCLYDEVNLNAINTLRSAFRLSVGYSDHTIGTEVAVAAVTLGAKVIEKHFTLDCNMEGPDHVASTEPDEFRHMVDQIRHIEHAFGDGIKRPALSELNISQVVTKRVVALRNIEKGEVFSDENITIKRNDIGMSAKYWDLVIGKNASKNYFVDDGIEI